MDAKYPHVHDELLMGIRASRRFEKEHIDVLAHYMHPDDAGVLLRGLTARNEDPIGRVKREREERDRSNKRFARVVLALLLLFGVVLPVLGYAYAVWTTGRWH